MTVTKRDSRLRRWARKLGGCVRNWRTHRKLKSSYLEPSRATSLQRRNAHLHQHTPLGSQKEQLGSRHEQPLQTPLGSKRLMPSPGKLRTVTPPAPPTDKTIRVVNASKNSLVRARQEEQTPTPAAQRKEQTKHTAPTARPTFQKSEGGGPLKLAHPPSVLSWQESARTQHLIARKQPETSSSAPRHDSGTELSLGPMPQGQCALPQAGHADVPSIAKPMTITKMEPITIRPSNQRFVESAQRPKPTFTTVPFEPVPGWEHDWDKPLHHRIGGEKRIWKSASDRLMIRNKDSIQMLEAEQMRMQGWEKMEVVKRETPQVRSIQSIEEMAEEDRRADAEWGGIAAQLAVDAQSPDIQEVGSFSFRQGKRAPAARYRGGRT